MKEGSNSEVCEAGTPVKCGADIRLEHADTHKNLHSHLFRAPLSGNQEVSAFGDGGVGDSGDNWQIVCESSDAYWSRDKPVSLRHVDTGRYLSSSNANMFTQQNCGAHCPIMNQGEVSAATKKDVRSKWQTDQGMYFPASVTAAGDKVEDGDDEL